MHITRQHLADKAGVSEKTIERYFRGELPDTILESTFYSLLGVLNKNAAEFEAFVNGHVEKDQQGSAQLHATSGPTININTGNTISNSPIGTQGNVTFNQSADKE